MRSAFAIRHRFALLVVLLATARPAAAVTVATVHAFSGTDGSHPMAGLFLGAMGSSMARRRRAAPA